MKRPHITRRNGLWVTMLGGETIYLHTDLADAFESAYLVWRFQ